jgi:hypothetical protein
MVNRYLFAILLETPLAKDSTFKLVFFSSLVLTQFSEIFTRLVIAYIAVPIII